MLDAQRSSTYTACLIWARSILASLGICCIYASLSYIALAEMTSIYAFKTFLIGLVCWVVLREAFGWRLQLATGGAELST